MFHIYFLGSSEGLIFDVANANFDVALWNPLRRLSGVARRSVPHRRDRHRRRRRPTVFVSAATPAPTSTADAVVLATDVAGLRASSTASPGLGDDGLARTRRRAAAPRRRSWCSGCGWTGRCARTGRRSSAPAAGRRWTTSACWSATNGRRRRGRAAPAVPSSNCTPTPVTGPQRGPARPPAGPAARALPRNRRRARVVDERVLCRNDCPRFAPGDSRRPARPWPRRIRAVVLAGDGIRIDLPVALMERAATTGWSAANRLLGALRAGRAHPAHRADPGPVADACDGSPHAKGSWRDEHARRTAGRDGRRRRRSRCFRAQQWASQRPTYQRRRARRSSTPRCERSQRRPSGNWYAFAASDEHPQGAHSAPRSAGWRSSRGAAPTARCMWARRTCPHLGADLATGTVDCGALICPWHGLRLDGRSRVRLEALSRPRRRRAGLGPPRPHRR